jgi:hypothetical protein
MKEFIKIFCIICGNLTLMRFDRDFLVNKKREVKNDYFSRSTYATIFSRNINLGVTADIPKSLIKR